MDQVTEYLALAGRRFLNALMSSIILLDWPIGAPLRCEAKALIAERATPSELVAVPLSKSWMRYSAILGIGASKGSICLELHHLAQDLQ